MAATRRDHAGSLAGRRMRTFVLRANYSAQWLNASDK